MDIKEKIKYFYEVVVSNCFIDNIPEYVSENCTYRIGNEITPMGIEGMREHIIGVKKTYPDFKMTIVRQYIDKEYVISEFIVEGRHEGEWLGIKPTGKLLLFTGVDIDKIEKEKIIEHGGAMNTFDTLFKERIIIPAP